MTLGFGEIILIGIVIVLLFNGKRLTKLLGAFRQSKTEYREGLEEPVDAEFKDVSEDKEKVEQKR